MAYTPIGWINDQAPSINQTNLDKMDNQIYENSKLWSESGPENFSDGAFGFHVAFDNTSNTRANPIMSILTLKELAPIETIKVKVSYIIHSFSSWNYFSIRYGNAQYNANQRIRTIQNGVALNTIITDTVEFTPTMRVQWMRFYFEKGSAIGVSAELLNVEIYVNGKYTGFTIDTTLADETVTINPKGNIASIAYSDEHYASKVSDIDTGKLLLPNYYMVCPDIKSDNMYGLKIFADWITFDSKTTFDNLKDHISIYPPLSQTNNVSDVTKELNFLQNYTEKAQSQTIHIISTKESVADKKLKILVMGDSVTAGYGADGHDYVKLADKHLHINSILKESGITPVFLGTVPKNITFEYDGDEYTDHLGCEGYSGKSLKDFYDGSIPSMSDPDASGDCKFSIATWLSKYRTMDDDGNRLSLDDPNIGSLVTAENIDVYNVCTPNVVVINLGHNDFYQGFTSNMQAHFNRYNEILNVIRTQCPDAYIIVCVTMSLTKCLHPNFYPDYCMSSGVNISPSTPNYIDRYKTNANYWKNFIGTNTDGHILVMPEWNITPTKDAYKWDRTSNESDDMYYTKNEFGNAHPYIPAHEVYGYELYAMCQYIKTLM